jgi:hypothetical protein
VRVTIGMMMQFLKEQLAFRAIGAAVPANSVLANLALRLHFPGRTIG